MSRTLLAALGLSSTVVCAASCQSAPTAPRAASLSPASAQALVANGAHEHTVAASAQDPSQLQGIAEVRQLLAPFHNFDKAVESGYSVAAPGPGVCISDPVRGGMGYHYTRADKDLVGDGVVNLLEPEFIVYSPERNGRVRLSAVDYFVPYNTWPHAEPPSLLGVPFAAEDGFQAWVLHIWAFWPNPAGIFQNYNPDVPLCPE